MKASDLVNYIQHPELLNKESIPELQKLVSDFPYFQSGHILLSLAAKKWDASVYQQSIKRTAIVVSDRAHLYNLMHKPEPLVEEQKIEEPVAEEIKEAVIVTEKIVEEKKGQEQETVVVKPEKQIEERIEQEIEKAVVNSFVEKELLKIKQEKPPEPESFGDWLQFLKKNNGEPYEQIAKKVKEEKEKQLEKKQEDESVKAKNKQRALIDKIIDLNPGPIRQKEEQKFFKPDIKAKESLLENEHLVTETLAQIYAMQGNFNKAIRAYEILSLKYPQKSVYFASLIEKLKNNE